MILTAQVVSVSLTSGIDPPTITTFRMIFRQSVGVLPSELLQASAFSHTVQIMTLPESILS